MSKRHIIAIAALSTLLAQDLKAGDLLVRARAVHLNSVNKYSTGLDLSINNKWLPEVDFIYFLSPNLATELILTVPQKHTLSAGLNYTRFSSVKLPTGVDIKRNSVGASLQAGVDIPVGKDLYLNVDVKKVAIGTKVSAGGKEIGKFKVDPVLVGVGLGWKF